MSTEKKLWMETCGGKYEYFLPLSSDSEGARGKIDMQRYKLILITTKIEDFLAEFHYFLQILA